MLEENQLNQGILHTTNDCVGCNKCISVCPAVSANIAVYGEGENKIHVDHRRCILCGKCTDVCTHDARTYMDDTDAFLEALADKTRNISLLVAPSFLINYPERGNKVLGYLKHLGVRSIYSVSVGADISVWGYVNYMQAHPEKGLISQPCPVIINYIESYKPDLVSRIIPVQSPVICMATYLRKYLGITDELAFLSPCIAKKGELERPENAGLVNYNVTYNHLMKKLRNVDVSSYYAADSEMDYSVGALFPMRVFLSSEKWSSQYS